MINLFVTSDKKGSGKTFISSGIASIMQSLGYSVGYFKPVQTAAEMRAGFPVSRDIAFVKSVDPYINTAISYSFANDLIPPLASKKENIEIKPQTIIHDYLNLRKNSDIIITEACGGILTPISENINTVDLIKTMEMSVLIVAEYGTDVLENILLTVAASKFHGFDVRGVILNKCFTSTNENIKYLPELVEKYAKIPVLGIIPYKNENIPPSELLDTILHSVDIESIFGMQIPQLSFNNKNQDN